MKATLSSSQDWGAIFSKIRALKETGLYLDREHTKEVQDVLSEFKKRAYLEKQNDKVAFIKNLTLFVDNTSYEVFNTLQHNFLKVF